MAQTFPWYDGKYDISHQEDGASFIIHPKRREKVLISINHFAVLKYLGSQIFYLPAGDEIGEITAVSDASVTVKWSSSDHQCEYPIWMKMILVRDEERHRRKFRESVHTVDSEVIRKNFHAAIEVSSDAHHHSEESGNQSALDENTSSQIMGTSHHDQFNSDQYQVHSAADNHGCDNRYVHAIDISVTDEIYHSFVAAMLSSNLRYKEAVELLESSQSSITEPLVHCLRQMGRYKEARERNLCAFHKCEREDEKANWAYNIADIYYCTGQAELAIRVIKYGLQCRNIRNQIRSKLEVLLANILAEDCQYEKALYYYAENLKVAGNFEDMTTLHGRMALVFAKLGFYRAAKKLFEASKICQGCADAHLENCLEAQVLADEKGTVGRELRDHFVQDIQSEVKRIQILNQESADGATLASAQIQHLQTIARRYEQCSMLDHLAGTLEKAGALMLEMLLPNDAWHMLEHAAAEYDKVMSTQIDKSRQKHIFGVQRSAYVMLEQIFSDFADAETRNYGFVAADRSKARSLLISVTHLSNDRGADNITDEVEKLAGTLARLRLTDSTHFAPDDGWRSQVESGYRVELDRAMALVKNEEFHCNGSAAAAQTNIAILQYSIISGNRLHIWVLRKDQGVELKKVVTSEELFDVMASFTNWRELQTDHAWPIKVQTEMTSRILDFCATQLSLQTQISNVDERDKPKLLDDRRQHLRILHTLCVEPVWRFVEGCSRLLIVPDGPLYKVPWSALLCLRSPEQPLEVQIQLVPSLLILQQIQTRAEKKSDWQQCHAVVVANPNLQDPKKNLSAAEEEGENVAELLREQLELDVKHLKGNLATLAEVKKAAANAVWLHFAGHSGRFSGTEDGRDDGSIGISLADGYWCAHEVESELQLSPGCVVILSICRSAEGPKLAEGVDSLARAFLTAGAACVVATLYKVNDEPAKQFMSQFYNSLLLDQASGPLSLQKAQLYLQLNDGKMLENDWQWPAFVIIGDDPAKTVRQLLSRVVERRDGGIAALTDRDPT